MEIKTTSILIILFAIAFLLFACSDKSNVVIKDTAQTERLLSAKDILGNPDYPAISYGGYRHNTRDKQPSKEEVIEDLRILHAMGIRILRTYNTKLRLATTVLEAIRELKNQEEDFEMYLMLGAWIDCENAWTNLPPNHEKENEKANKAEIDRAISLSNMYPDIVKIIAVGNEAMVKWATSYYVQPDVILKWVNHLQDLKKNRKLPADLWITSSDNFASWGGEDALYHTEDLNKLYQAVDYVSIHTYPMHDTHYNPDFWGLSKSETELSEEEKIKSAMIRAKEYAVSQYHSVVDYMKSIGVDKPVHIGETGWATSSNGHYGPAGSKATDEYKQAMYYQLTREWTDSLGLSCFYFEAFDEVWKDAANPNGSENHFGIFNINGQAKYALWNLVDSGVFEGLGRDGIPITKTYDGNIIEMMKSVLMPPINEDLDIVLSPQMN